MLVGFFGKWDDHASPLLQEPLLNGGSVSEICLGNVSLFSNAGSMLTFSWMGPLLSLGHKKILDLKDIPKLDHPDTVDGVYPIFRSKLDSYASVSSASDGDKGVSSPSGITPFRLAKALAFSIRTQIATTAVYVLVESLASYVGPYLIDDFVQYLNGNRHF